MNKIYFPSLRLRLDAEKNKNNKKIFNNDSNHFIH